MLVAYSLTALCTKTGGVTEMRRGKEIETWISKGAPEGVVVDNYTIIKDDLLKFNYALVMLEKITFFIEEFTDYKILYNFTISLLDKLNNQYPNLPRYLNHDSANHLYKPSPHLCCYIFRN